ncbi:MAG: membrane protein insertion efficiency factor YidD [Proteobacteria bacterium]|jgi:putative membrane protein insertion efficiency factor|nr:membrane protein insertion efficiency factor YidD [Pseudomonadota bacterium]MDA1299974.1 membrane protein insertion efficiency factor YidD [Pseudomonadota bacterium]
MKFVRKLLIGMIWLYQAALSGFLGNRCRFHPTCSHYAMQAIEQHGPLEGTRLAVCRLAKCHPFHPGGIDEVPTGNQPSPDHVALESR